MPTIRPKSPVPAEADPSSDVVFASGATESHIFATEEWKSRDNLSRTGSLTHSSHEAMDKRRSNSATSETLQLAVETCDVPIGVISYYNTPISNEPGKRFSNGLWTMTPASAKQGTPPELSPLVRRQIEQIATDLSPKLQQRLDQFGWELPNQEPVAGPIMATVGDLVAWLSEQADTVSATLSDDGMLSIVTVFPKDVRLYIEIERDGSIGAAVTRERRYARDISGSTVADLTPEVILAAVESI